MGIGKPGAMSAEDDYLPDVGNGGYRVRHYDLTLAYRAGDGRLSGQALVHLTPDRDLSRFSFDLTGLEVSGVTVDGHKAERIEQRGAKLLVWPADVAVRGHEREVAITYGGVPSPVESVWGYAGWDSLTDGVIVANQPNGAASWFPCNDHPSNKATFQITVTANSRYTVIASGTLQSRHEHKDRTTRTFLQSDPIATSQASVQIGQYEHIDLGKRPVRLSLYAAAPRVARASTDFARLRNMLKVFERTFGPYPYSSYCAVVTEDELDVPLTTQGMAIFGANHVDGKQKRERLIAHELAHQWFGGSVTPRAWQHVWLSEGFATYAEWLWSETSGGPSAGRLAAKNWAHLSQLADDLVIADPQPEFMFDERVYLRGALALHRLHRDLGDVQFANLVTTWTTRHRHSTVTTDDFVALVRKRAGKDSAQQLERWIGRKRLPDLPEI